MVDEATCIRQRDIYKARKAAGLCTTCGKKEAANGHVSCADCFTKKKSDALMRASGIKSSSRKASELPFDTEQCNYCKWWQWITSGTKACHLLVYSCGMRKRNPPNCDRFAPKDEKCRRKWDMNYSIKYAVLSKKKKSAKTAEKI